MKNKTTLISALLLTFALGSTTTLIASWLNNYHESHPTYSQHTREHSPRSTSRGQNVKLLRVIDGDTIEVQNGSTHERIRIAGIDAPEHDQEGGEEATQQLNRLIRNGELQIDSHGQDKNGRTIADVSINNKDVGLAMVESGAARHYTHYDSRAEYNSAEASAKRAHKGIWANPNAVAPWDYRHRVH